MFVHLGLPVAGCVVTGFESHNTNREEVEPEEQLRRIRAAIAEAGYPSVAARVWWCQHDGPVVPLSDDGVPDEVCWMAFHVARLDHCCWPCWRDGIGEFCTHDPHAEELPVMPRG